MYCESCGALVKDNKKKCPYCKQRLDIKKKEEKLANKKTGFWDWKKIVCLIFAFIPIVGLLAAYNYRFTSKKYLAALITLAVMGLISNTLIMIFCY